MRVCICVCLPVFESGGVGGGVWRWEVAKQEGASSRPDRLSPACPLCKHIHRPPASEVTQTDRQTQTWGGATEGTEWGVANEPGRGGTGHMDGGEEPGLKRQRGAPRVGGGGIPTGSGRREDTPTASAMSGAQLPAQHV